MTPAVSVITPTWNRVAHLERVWSSLARQTEPDFEWIVGDDGSNDGTDALVRALAGRSAFPVLYIRATAHVGKARMDNEAIARARGELTLWCDSDDRLTPDAVERILGAWRAIPKSSRDKYSGLTALAATEERVIIDPFEEARLSEVSWNDLAALHHVEGDMVYVARTSCLQQCPFPEVDLVVPESSVWNVIGRQPTRVIRKVLLIKEYRGKEGISFSGKMSYNRGRAYSAAITARELRAYPLSRLTKAWRMLNFIRYSRHGELSLVSSRQLWGDNSTSIAFWSAVPLAATLALRDCLSGKVVRSHREFEANRGASITATWLQERAVT